MGRGGVSLISPPLFCENLRSTSPFRYRSWFVSKLLGSQESSGAPCRLDNAGLPKFGKTISRLI